MNPNTPRRLGVAVFFGLLFAVSPVRADDPPGPPSPALAAAERPAPPAESKPAETALKASPELVKLLEPQGFKVQPDLSILRVKDGVVINCNLLAHAGFLYNLKGDLVYSHGSRQFIDASDCRLLHEPGQAGGFSARVAS